MNETQMYNTKTTDFGYMKLELTEMPVNKKGQELGWKQQFKEVRTWGPDNGSLSGKVCTSYYWQGECGKHIFRSTQK